MTLREDIADEIKNKRPKVSPKSVATYVSTLFSLPKKYGEGVENIGVDWFAKNTDKLLDELKDVTANKRKSVLSALFILTGDKEVHTKMIEDVKVVNDHYKTQSKSEIETENWIDWRDIITKHNDMTKQANSIFKKKLLNAKDVDTLNDYVLLSCYVLFPPRRLLDYSEMKIRNFDDKGNSMKNGKMTFNTYKTAKFYGAQTFDMGKELTSIVKKWAKINEGDYLIMSKSGKPLSSPQMNAKLNGIFDKNVSSNMLRHSFLTHFYGGKMPSMLDMEDMSKKMGHSINQALLYVKRD